MSTVAPNRHAAVREYTLDAGPVADLDVRRIELACLDNAARYARTIGWPARYVAEGWLHHNHDRGYTLADVMRVVEAYLAHAPGVKDYSPDNIAAMRRIVADVCADYAHKAHEALQSGDYAGALDLCERGEAADPDYRVGDRWGWYQLINTVRDMAARAGRPLP